MDEGYHIRDPSQLGIRPNLLLYASARVPLDPTGNQMAVRFLLLPLKGLSKTQLS